MSDNYDQLALSWVRKEINNTLDQARQGLENFAEDIQDQTQIQFCINCLHQVQGTLQMLEFVGAAKLAHEMEMLADKMANDPKFAVEAVFEVLMRALLQMPGYLERVEEGQKDIPVVLLPLINELRSAGARSPISERELFSADTVNVLPPKAVEIVSETDKTTSFQDNAKKLRAHFQKGLTGLIRGQGIKESLSRIHKVLLRLEALTEGQPVARLWWVADGFIFSTAENGLYKKKEVHQLLAKVDRQIRRLSDDGAAAMSDVIPEKLLTQLLYFVARSQSKNSRILALKKEFNLEAGLADSDEIKKHQKKLSRPDSSAIINVVGAINEELTIVKDQLDLYVRSKNKEPSQLQSIVDSLDRIADTLTLLELAIPRDVIRQQIKSIQKLLDVKQMPDDSLIMDIAGALLFVEANLKNVNLEKSAEVIDESESSERSRVQAKESQVDEATQALIKVARKSMQSAKDKMINYIASGFERKALAEVPKLLEEVLGGVRIIQFEQAADVLQIAKDYIEKRIVGYHIQPQEEQLDALADVITSVEYYLEASEDGGHRGVNSILKGAQKSIELLEQALKHQPVIEAAKEPILNDVPDWTLHQEDTDDDSLLITETTDSDIAKKHVIEVHNESQKDEVPPPRNINNIVSISNSIVDKKVDESLIDDEVLEIFLEEAEEEIEALNLMIPRWANNLQDDEALSTIRRSFHTLKGSGRLVGANVIGEVSWSVENMLNKVIEESIPAEMPVMQVLNEARSMMPSLVAAFAAKTLAACDYSFLIAKAEHIAAGKSLADFERAHQATLQSESEELPTIGEPIESVAEIKEEPIDPVLLEIFTAEADSHLKNISIYLNDAPHESTAAVTDELIRALHTLKGSANMAGVLPIASLTGPWEKFTRMVKGSNQRLESPVVELLDDTYQALSSMLENLKSSQSIGLVDIEALEARIALLSSSGTNLSGSSSHKQRDQQFVSIFLTEGLDILHEVSRLNTSLENDLNNQTLRQAIKAELHTFNRGAEMLAIDELEILSAESEKLASFAVENDELEGGFNYLLVEVVENLTSMLNKIATEEDVESPQNTVSKIQAWMELASSQAVPDEMDVELTELFVEEAEELIESARELTVRWRDNLTSKSLNGELRRIFHTLKGSSRMAGAMNIGDLSYAVEDIFNTVVEFGREPAQKDFEIVDATTDKLEKMVAVLKTLRWPKSAEQEIRVIRMYLSPQDFEEEIVVTPITEESIPIIMDTVEEAEIEEISFEAPELEETEVEEYNLDIPEIAETQIEEISFEVPEIEETETEEISFEVPEIEETEIEEISFEVPEMEETEIEEISLDIPELEETEIEEISFEAPEIADAEENEIELTEVISPVVPIKPLQVNISSGKMTEVTVENLISPSEASTFTGNVQKIVLDEDGEEVLEIYLEEADELLVALDEALNDWSESLDNKNAIDVLQRTLHTFKGGARLSDLAVLGDLTHEMETYFERISAGQLKASRVDVDFILRGYDVIEKLVNEVRTSREMTIPEDYMNSLALLIQGKAIQVESKSTSQPIKEAEPSVTEKVDKATVEAKAKPKADVVSFELKKQQQEEVRAKAPQVTDVVRVASDQLENLVNLAGETSIFRSRLEQQMSVLRYNLEEMSSTVDRLRDQLRNLDIETDAQISYRREVSGGSDYEDFDPLEMDRYTRQQELTRGLSESAVDLLSLKETLDLLTADSETLLLQQGRINTEMQESLMRTRMIPFESLVPRLRRMVRQISTELGKTIELSISADGEMDRTVLERMVAPLEHMLRNAMDHGIETPEERKANQKSKTGTVRISMYREGSEVFVKIQDDGRGLNLVAIRKKAIEKGLITQKSELSDHELQQLILEAGFSTAEHVTQISGRGVGMDVVSSEIKQLGGVIEIDSLQGQGTTFTVKLPFTMSVNHALMVQLGDDVYAIPLANIEGIVRVSPFELEEYYSNPESHFGYAGINYSMYYLGQILDHNRTANLQGVTQPLPVLLLHGADHPTALQVDNLLGSREIVVKSIGSQLSSISGLSGATILGDGRVVLILDMPALIRRIDATLLLGEASEVEVVDERVPVIMVVDDSITVRKVTKRLLERHDFEVITAKDGVDALSLLGEHKPDVMLLDIEMPRMDGFELATIIRHDDALKDLPIIMITSRTGEKHRERAEQIGVNQYMGKPYNEVDLLESISALLPKKS